MEKERRQEICACGAWLDHVHTVDALVLPYLLLFTHVGPPTFCFLFIAHNLDEEKENENVYSDSFGLSSLSQKVQSRSLGTTSGQSTYRIDYVTRPSPMTRYIGKIKKRDKTYQHNQILTIPIHHDARRNKLHRQQGRKCRGDSRIPAQTRRARRAR